MDHSEGTTKFVANKQVKYISILVFRESIEISLIESMDTAAMTNLMCLMTSLF